jgi:hypothetical protein
MANITLSTTLSNLVVDATNNIITVASTPASTIVFTEGGGLDQAAVRLSLSNVAPILYDSSTGVFSFDSNATFSGKTTDNLPQGNSNIYFSTSGAAVNTTNLPEGTNLYFTAARARGNVSANTATGASYNSSTGVFSLSAIPNSSLTNTTVTINGKSVALGSSNTLTTSDIGEGTNLYFTAARARGNVSATDAGGMGAFSYSSASGVFTYTGPSDSEVRAVISAANTTTGHGNISYNNSTGVITFNRVTAANILGEITAGNVKLKQFSETVHNVGNTFGNISINAANGSTQTLTLVGNVTGISFTNITAGSTVTLILRQDAIGYRLLNTTSFSSNWTNWDFVGDHTTLTVDPNAYDILTVTYDGTNYFASLVNFNTPVIQNSQLANSNITVNGVTIALGGSGTINTFNAATVNGNLTVNGNINATGNINVQNVEDLYVRDQTIVLNANAASPANVQIVSNRPGFANTEIKWNEQTDAWTFTNNGTTYYPIPTSTTDLAEGANLWYTVGRANTAIDNRVTKSFVEALAISYTSLSDKPSIPTHTSNLINDSGFITTANANVISVNGKTGAVTLTTTDVNEGANLYYTTDRANSAIGAYQGAISTAGNITTTANVSGQYILGNGAFLTGITGSGTVTQVNTGENLTGGPITTTGTIGMANTLANVNGVSSETASNLTLATNKQITVTTRQRNNDVTNSANITGEGFALSQTDNFFNAPFFSYSGSEQLKTIGINGSTTAGSNVISVTSLRDMQNNALNISNVKPYYAFTDQPLLSGGTTIFPAGTYVVSASGSNIFMSANALYSEPLNFDPGDPYGNSFGALSPGAYDATTGLLVALESNFDGGGANAQLITFNFLNNVDLKYGYGPNGPATTNFAYSIGTSSDYSINTNVINNFLFGRTDFSADQTVANFRRGVTIGDADLTNRGENDGVQTFGLNIVWDGTANTNADYGTTGVFPQMLLKQYTTGTYQATSLTNAGPRLLFIGANGKNTDDPLTTYARNNQELGRISWLSTTSLNSAPGTLGTPAYISVVSNRDQTTGPGGVGMYFVAAPTDASLGAVGQVGAGNARQLWAAAHRGNTIISAGAPFNGNSGNVLFAPARQSSNEGNAVLLAQRIVDGACASPHWATIGYDVPTSNTGARISVTNGHNTASARNGNLSVALNRRDNAVGFGTKEWALKLRSGQTDLVLTEDGVIRTTFTGANITTAGNVSASTFLGNIVGTTGNFTGNVSASTVNAAFFVGDGSNITNINYSNANVQQYLAFGLGSNNINTTGNVSASTFLGNINGTTGTFSANVDVTGNINLTGRLLGYDRVYGEFAYTAGNIVPVAADTIYAFPLDTTLINSDVIANNTSRINITKPGFYKLFSSIQVKNSDNANDHILRFWLRKNGADVANSATLITPLKLQEQVVSMHWMVESDGDDYWEIVYYVNDTDVTFPYYGSIASPVTAPAAPPIIVNVIPVGA